MDGSSAPSLVKPSSAQDGELQIADFKQFAAHLHTLYRTTHKIEQPEPGVISLTRDAFVKIFIGAEIFKDIEKSAHFITVIDTPNMLLSCVGLEQDLDLVPEPLQRPEVQQLALPVGSATIKTVLRSLHNFQKVSAGHHEKTETVRLATENVKQVMSISRELNGERDIPKLLNLILTKAREVCRADAGSIYTLDYDAQTRAPAYLKFRFTQNSSITQNLSEFKIPINTKSIVGNAVVHKVPINIPDLYLLSKNPDENPFGVTHDSTWDRRIGYESHSMLTVPMFDISYQVIGVIQLINHKRNFATQMKTAEDFAHEVTPFTEEDQEYAEIVAQQAGIALENAAMHEEIQSLFNGFVNASVKAIEQRDPTTSGHSNRVAKLTTNLAITVDRALIGPYKEVKFTPDQLKEIEYAALLHDFGKLGVREAVLVKAKKLYDWQQELLVERWEVIRSSYEIEYLKKVINYLNAPNLFPPGFTPENFLMERDRKLADLDTFWKFVQQSNEPTVLAQGSFEKLNDIAKCNYCTTSGQVKPFLKNEELKSLSVAKGSLTSEEFVEIQNHVVHTYEFLRTIPWGRKLANVPEIAAKHHEKIDGSGYPMQAEADQIPIQSRMMTIADMYDALTAADRPYKKAVPVEKALDIINMEVRGGKVDSALFEIFIQSQVFKIV